MNSIVEDANKPGAGFFKIWIDGNVPSLKNSKIATSRGVFMSKTCKRYLQALGIQKYSVKDRVVTGYKTRPNLFWEAVKPVFGAFDNQKVMVSFYFIRDSKRKFDIINAQQIICDLLVAHRIIQDDDADHLLPAVRLIDGRVYHIDKSKPGVWLYFMGR